MSEVSDFFAQMGDKFNADKAAGMDCIYQFDISGDDGGQWAVTIKDGAASVIEGTVDDPSITISMTDENFVGLVTGQLNGQTAFLTGKLKIQGDMTLAMKLQTVFSLG